MARLLAALVVGAVGSGIGYVCLSRLVTLVGVDLGHDVTECVQGLSGALFALKVLALAEVDTIW